VRGELVQRINRRGCNCFKKVKLLALLVLASAAFLSFSRQACGQNYAAGPPESAVLPADLLANHCYTTIGKPIASADWRSFVHIGSSGGVRDLRTRLINQIWPGGFPGNVVPTSVIQTVSGNSVTNSSGLFPFLSNDEKSYLKTEYRLTAELGFGVRSVIYLWESKAPKNRLFLFHDGHSDDAFDANGDVKVRGMVNSTNFVTVETLLKAGYDVMWIQMPLYGDNLSASTPQSPLSAQCGAKCDRHAQLFSAFSVSSVNPYRFFLEPVVVAINYASATRKYSDISMMGASGGGWTTLLAAAIDVRITNSASVAGSLPLFLRTGICGKASVGDAEQKSHMGLLYNAISYLDLYIMASNGVNRQHLQINNQFDTCCFFGIAYSKYADHLSKLISEKKLGVYKYELDTGFVGHGYNASVGAAPANNTLNDLILPAFRDAAAP
jgi:hypothetical protein